MKSCPACNSSYPRDFTLCPRDGTRLIEVGVWSEGTLIRGKYRIISKIGVGGMAAVFKAMHIRFEELRALKVISAELASDPSFVKRLQQEAVVTRRLQHPNAVRVEDIDEAEDGRPFIVMEYIEGRSLKDLIEEAAPLSVPRTLSIIKQAASALDAAHALGILHRDIKPANIVLIQTPEGEQAKVLDFGIAKVKETNLGDTADMTLTGQGRVVGTSAYMSPEQAMGMRGEELDGRSDLYSLGVVMYQMLVGDLPLKAESEVTMLMAHIQTPPQPIREIRPDVPEPVANLVMSCLEKNRELRPKSGRALIEAIERWQRGEKDAAAASEAEETILYRQAYQEPSTPSASVAQAPAASRAFPAAPVEPAAPSEPFAVEDVPAAFPPPAAEEATMLASGFGAGIESSPPSPAPAFATPEEFSGGGATMMVSGFGSVPEPSQPPPPAAPAHVPESYTPGEATAFAPGLGQGPSSEAPPASAPWSSEAYPGDEATMLASGFGAGSGRESAWEPAPGGSNDYPGSDLPSAALLGTTPKHEPPLSRPPLGTGTDAYERSAILHEEASAPEDFGLSSKDEPQPLSPFGAGADAYPREEATMLASGFGMRPENEPSPAPPSGSGAGAYQHDEATMLASGLGSTQGSYEPLAQAAPESHLPHPEASSAGLSPDVSALGMARFGETHEAPPPAPSWEAAPQTPPSVSSWEAAPQTPPSAPSWEAPPQMPPPSPAWDASPQAPPPAAPAVPVQETQPRKSSNWMIWAAVPIVAAGLTLGAWFFLTRTTSGPQPEGGGPSSVPATAPSSGPASTPAGSQPVSSSPANSPSSTPASSPPAGTAAPAQEPGGQSATQTPSGAGAPAAGAAAAGQSSGQPVTDQTKAPSDTKAEAPKEADVKAAWALKGEGDADFDKGDYDGAINAYRKALKLDPKSRILNQQIARAKKAQETEKSLLR